MTEELVAAPLADCAAGTAEKEQLDSNNDAKQSASKANLTFIIVMIAAIICQRCKVSVLIDFTVNTAMITCLEQYRCGVMEIGKDHLDVAGFNNVSAYSSTDGQRTDESLLRLK